MDRQRLFEDSMKPLLRQARKSVRPEADTVGPMTICLYRSPEGCRCAIGWLIPDELYDPDMEGSAVTDLLKREPRLDARWGVGKRESPPLWEVDKPRENELFLDDLQDVHDQHEPEEWPLAIIEFAANWELDASWLPGHLRELANPLYGVLA